MNIAGGLNFGIKSVELKNKKGGHEIEINCRGQQNGKEL